MKLFLGEPGEIARRSFRLGRGPLLFALSAGVLGTMSSFGCSSDSDTPATSGGETAGTTGTTGGTGGGTTGTTGSSTTDTTGGMTDTTGDMDAGSGGMEAGTNGGMEAGSGGTEAGAGSDGGSAGSTGMSDDSGADLVSAGQQAFRYDTLGDEAFWTDTLHMNQVVATITPETALSVGLKVDSEKVPADVLASADLKSPATTIALLKLDAVLGVKGEVSSSGELTKIGITCALCHSDVDNSVTTGIGKRIDGKANRDLNPGAIIALSPAMTDQQKQVLNSWGKGRFDPRWNRDGINLPVEIPPIYGLKDVALETYTGDGPVSYWNSYVGVTQMGGTPERVALALGPLFEYQMSLVPPTPPASSFDAAAAARGKSIFENEGKCSTCHTGTALTDAAMTLHPPTDSVADDLKTPDRSVTKQFRTTPLRALWQHPPYLHDGSAATLADVVDRYNTKRTLGLTDGQKADLVEYLKSL